MRIICRDPRIVVVLDAVVSPLRRLPDKTFAADVIDVEGHFVPLAGRSSQMAIYKQIPPDIVQFTLEPQRNLGGTWLYGGILFNVYGHDLLEMPARLWPLLPPGEHINGVVFHRWLPQLNEPTPVGAAILKAFGVEHIHAVDLPTRVEKLIVPEITWQIQTGAFATFRKLISHLVKEISICSLFQEERIFFSRRGLEKPPRSNREQEIEAAAIGLGYFVVYPELHTLGEQIALMRQARVVAGISGSAMHNAMFMRPQSKVVCFDAHLAQDQFLIEKLFDLEATHVNITDELDAGAIKTALSNV